MRYIFAVLIALALAGESQAQRFVARGRVWGGGWGAPAWGGGFVQPGWGWGGAWGGPAWGGGFTTLPAWGGPTWGGTWGGGFVQPAVTLPAWGGPAWGGWGGGFSPGFSARVRIRGRIGW